MRSRLLCTSILAALFLRCSSVAPHDAATWTSSGGPPDGAAPGSQADANLSEVDSSGHESSSSGSTPSGSSGAIPGPDASNDADAHPVQVTACDALGAVGEWQDITPAQVCLTCAETPGNQQNFGTAALVVDPQNPSTVYLGTEGWGFYKSTDCGGTWTKANTGRNGAELDGGSQWTLVIDPVDSNVLYTNIGFGTNGIFKSTNGGQDWDQILTGMAQQVAPYGGHMGTYSMDPNDHNHIIASFHAACSAPMVSACFVETLDAGATWTARNGDPSWAGGEHTIIEFLDSTTWFFGNADGLWRSIDSGMTWTQVPGSHSIVHHQQLYRSAHGVYFQSTQEGLLYTNDNGVNWTLLAGSPQLSVGVVGTGDTVYTCRAGPWATPGQSPYSPYYSVSEVTPTASPMVSVNTPAMGDGGLFMAYDPVHHVVYSSNFPAGVWRVVVK
jgi:hypothetical protein